MISRIWSPRQRAIACTSSLPLAQMATAKIGDTAEGEALVNSRGMTLYTFDTDAGGKSMCNGPRAVFLR
jgi:predicted lipoprotein with Yx(FWY)xxD motif